MTNYFCRTTGSDVNPGTSAGNAWRTLGKALGAAGIASGDKLYIGGGYIIREVVTIAMTSATVETEIIGDVDGAMTGDVGEVIWTNYLSGWHDTPSGSDCVNLAGRDFLTFRNITFISGAAGNCIDGTTSVSTDIKIDNCVLESYGTTPVIVTSAFATALNWTIQRSQIVCFNGSNAFNPVLTTGVGADYDANVQIIDSVLWAVSTTALAITNSGTAANKGGGVDLLRCTLLGVTGMTTSATNISTTVPCTVGDCLILANAGINAGTAGQITDLGGNIGTGSNTNVTAHATSKTSSDDFPAPLISLAHEWMFGMTPRRLFAPMFPPILSRGTIGTATTDMENRARPEGVGQWIDSGTATAGAATSITDGGKTWAVNDHIGRLVRTTGGTGSGQVKHISSNSNTVLTIGGLSGDWATTPDSTTTYIIYEGPPAETNKATSGSTTTFVVSGAAWSVSKWAGYDLAITAGTQSGTTRSIVSNTATTLTTAAFPGAIDSTSVGSIFWPSTSLTATQRTPGALELHDKADRETTTTDAGGVGLHIDGPGSVHIDIPVDATSTTISVKARYDANHGSTNKPRAILLANGEIGVTTETKTMTSAVDTWEQLSFTAQTPTAKGIVTVRLESRSDTPYGRSYWDTFG